MPRRTLIRSAAFADPCDLSPDDLIALSVDSASDLAQILLPNVNWNGGAVGCLSATLTADNERVESASFHLLGELWMDKVFNVSNFWPTTTATSLNLSLEDLTVFSFPEGSLVSNYVCSTELDYSFSQGSSTIMREDFDAAFLSEFCLRAFAHPTTDSFAKIVIMIYPCSLATLTAYPLFQDSRFPGIRLSDVEIPLAPIPTLSPLQKSWGFPLACAIFPGSDWTEAPGRPLGYRLRVALSELLRSACLPEAKATHASLLQRLQDISSSGDSLLTSKFPTLLWPPIVESLAVDQPPQGWFSFLLVFIPLLTGCATSLKFYFRKL